MVLDTAEKLVLRNMKKYTNYKFYLEANIENSFLFRTYTISHSTFPSKFKVLILFIIYLIVLFVYQEPLEDKSNLTVILATVIPIVFLILIGIGVFIFCFMRKKMPKPVSKQQQSQSPNPNTGIYLNPQTTTIYYEASDEPAYVNQ